jgi:N-acetylglutamate synthase-like GNAT family acetyltransferase
MVDMPSMYDSRVTIRRGRRTDLPGILALLTPTAQVAVDKAQARHWRRLAGDPSLDFYVAEQNGAILGALLVCYVRALREHGWRAILDLVLLPPSPCALGQDLVHFAKARARKRGCRQLIAWRREAAENGHLATLTQGGFHPVGEVLSCEL